MMIRINHYDDIHCNGEFFGDEKNVKIGAIKKKGDKLIDWNTYEDRPAPRFFQPLMGFRTYYEYELLEDAKVRYVTCPSCGERIWLKDWSDFDLIKKFKTKLLRTFKEKISMNPGY